MRSIATELWALLGADSGVLENVGFEGDPVVLPSAFDVTGLATATVGVASLAAAELYATRNAIGFPAVNVTSRSACAAFVCEHLFAPEGWPRPPIWDPIAGDYRADDGWIRLHTNYATHRAAALRALDLDDADRDRVAAAVSTRAADELEGSIVAAGGCAAALRTRAAWQVHRHGAASAHEVPAVMRTDAAGTPRSLAEAEMPLADVKVLDLTRVIAGPVCTRFLAAYGADVLRVDPPGFEEVSALVPETSAGKHCAALDLRRDHDREVFEQLLAEADVIVHGLRPGALDALGFDTATLRRVNPALIIATLDAYGWNGPWAGRRGFDSLVQMSCGIAAAPTGGDSPQPLPAQALDHGTGFVLAAAVCRALTERELHGTTTDIAGSLIGTANFLVGLAQHDGLSQPPPSWTDQDTAPLTTAWGPARAVPIPGSVDGVATRLRVEPGPLARHEARFDQ